MRYGKGKPQEIDPAQAEHLEHRQWKLYLSSNSALRCSVGSFIASGK